MRAEILDGKRIAAEIRNEVARDVEALARDGGRTPHLAAMLVGDNPMSEVYVRSKAKTAGTLGINSTTLRLPAESTTQGVLSEIRRLNDEEGVDGILVQLPLPAGVDTDEVLEEVDVRKDVDGFHPVNVGKLVLGRPCLSPCTPAGIIELLERNGIQIGGARACVLGRSRIVGKPMAALLLNRNATLTVCHSKSRNLAAVTREADILVAAIGRAGFITGDMVRPGAVVIDVGMNEISGEGDLQRFFEGEELRRRREEVQAKGRTLVGDVEWRSVVQVAGRITPVPGGVGPLTIAMLMKNVVTAHRMRCGR